MTSVSPWFERKFEFDFPIEQFPNILARLRGTPARIEEAMLHAPRELRIHKPDEKWSAQEHAGHLADIEPLWLARANDFLGGNKTLTATDLTNRRTHEAGHNARDIAEILRVFRQERDELLKRLNILTVESFAHSLIHPRLQQPMRLIDHLFFVAEHDDHHLATIWELLNQ